MSYYHSTSPQADAQRELNAEMAKLDWFEHAAEPGVAA